MARRYFHSAARSFSARRRSEVSRGPKSRSSSNPRRLVSSLAGGPCCAPSIRPRPPVFKFRLPDAVGRSGASPRIFAGGRRRVKNGSARADGKEISIDRASRQRALGASANAHQRALIASRVKTSRDQNNTSRRSALNFSSPPKPLATTPPQHTFRGATRINSSRAHLRPESPEITRSQSANALLINLKCSISPSDGSERDRRKRK